RLQRCRPALLTAGSHARLVCARIAVGEVAQAQTVRTASRSIIYWAIDRTSDVNSAIFGALRPINPQRCGVPARVSVATVSGWSPMTTRGQHVFYHSTSLEDEVTVRRDSGVPAVRKP